MTERVEEVEKRKRFQANPDSFIEIKDCLLVVMEPKNEEDEELVINDRCMSDGDIHIVAGSVETHLRRKLDFMNMKRWKKKEDEKKAGIQIVGAMPKDLK